MARKPNTETAKLLEVRNGKIDQLSQIADQIQHLRDTASHLHGDIEKLDFALSVLDPSHVPMDAQSNTSGRLLIDAKPADQAETKTVETSTVQDTTSEAQAPKRQAKAANGAKSKKAATGKKSASGLKAKSDPVPQSAVDAAKTISGTRSRSGNAKELRAREVINGYMTDLKPADEIETILKRGPKRGLTVEAIADAFVKSHPLEDAQGEVLMILKNRISSNIAHMMKKGIVGKGKPEGESLTHYFFQKKAKATPAPVSGVESATEALENPSDAPAEQVA